MPLLSDRLDARPHGAPIAVPSRPSQDLCDTWLRADIKLAVTIRAVMGVEGVDDTEAAAESAAGDPRADTLHYGIPLTQAELESANESIGPTDATVGLAGLVAARPETLNALWLDGDSLTVSVLQADQAVLERALCLERGPAAGKVQYVTAGIPAAELAALGDRIHAERDALKREGIEVTVVSSDPTTETVRVGVADASPAVVARLIDRYGTVVVVEETTGPRPAPLPPAPGPGG